MADVRLNLPASTSATKEESALAAARSPPLKLRETCRGLPVTGSGPAKARNCQCPGDRSRIVPGLVLPLELLATFTNLSPCRTFLGHFRYRGT